ncbi:MAG TPA: hypothetical protein VF628_06015 [Allosphingosinicella sp.]|jgi:hypothetical protein
MMRLTALLPLVLLACIGPSDAVRSVALVSEQQADAALAAFEASNPSCEIWSNWQKMCSRIGSTVHCTIDRAKRVKPSAPFCVGQWEEATEEEQASRMRFCEEPDYLTFGKRRLPACNRYRADRPFNGRRLKPIISPACAEWREEKTNKRAGPYSTSGYYCAHFTFEGCRDTSLRQAELSALKADSDGIIAGYEVGTRLDKVPVHGLSCGVGQ